MKLFNSPDEELRLQALQAVEQTNTEEVINLLIQAFGDDSWRVRKMAMDLFLLKPHSYHSASRIIDLLSEADNAGLRNAAVEVLIRLGPQILPLLIDQVTSEDPDVRKFVIDIIGHMATPESIPVLCQALDDEDNNVRAAAAENLGMIKAHEAVPDLLDALQKPDLLLRFTILEALGHIAVPVPLTKLAPFKEEKLLRKALLECLGSAGDASAIPELIAALTDPLRNLRESSVSALAKMAQRYRTEVSEALAESLDKDHVKTTLLNYLDEGVPEERKKSAIELLGCFADEDVVLRLLMLMDDDHLQQKALDSLIEIGQKTPEILLQLWSRLNTTQRCWVSFVFGETRTKEATDVLRSALIESDPQIVSMALYALGRIGALKAMPDILNCLNSSDREVQVAASRTLIDLGNLSPDQVILNLKPLCSQSTAFVRQLAVSVLGELNSADVLDILILASKDSDPGVRKEAVKGLSKQNFEEKVNVLQLCLTDENVEVRRDAVDGLATCDSTETLHGLSLAMQDSDMWVRAAAVRGLGRFDAASSIEWIDRAIQDPVGLVSIAALETLSRFHPEGALPKLLHALNHADEEVVRSSLELLDRYWDCDWIHKDAPKLINHDLALVRSHMARRLVDCQNRQAQSLLESRLRQETDELLKQELRHLLSRLTSMSS